MGHALTEIRRVLRPAGMVVDIRPFFPACKRNRREARRQIYVTTGSEMRHVGAVFQSLSGYRFTDRLVADVMASGLFRLTHHSADWIRWHFASHAVFRRYLETTWQGFKLTRRDEASMGRLIAQHPSAGIRVDTPVQFNLWTPGERL